MKNTVLKTFSLVVVATALFAVGGCKKEQKNTATEEIVITLQPGLVHVGTQWLDGNIWVESYDPITKSCLLRQYDTSGKMVETGSKVRLRGCRLDQAPAQNNSSETDAAANKSGQSKAGANKPAPKV